MNAECAQVRSDVRFGRFEARSCELSERTHRQRSSDPAAVEARRRIFFGEAVRAAKVYCGMDGALLKAPPNAQDLLSTAWQQMLSERPKSTKEDFALYFLSLLSRRVVLNSEYRAFRENALRYLEDNRAKLAPEILALHPSRPVVDGNFTATSIKRGGWLAPTGLADNLPCHAPKRKQEVSDAFVDAYLSLRHNLKKNPSKESQSLLAMDPPEHIDPASKEADSRIEEELKNIHSTRLRAIGRLRRDARRRRSFFVLFFLMVAFLGYITFAEILSRTT